MDWETFFSMEQQQEYYEDLMTFLNEEYRTKTIYPAKEDLFSGFRLCSYEQVKVVILGQDPYHEPGQAHGLSFSVKPGVKIPPSLRNIYKELKSDLDIDAPSHGYLIEWAKPGVLMMNAVMSVEAGKAGRHANRGWETFSDHVIMALDQHPLPIVFVFWGNWAKKKSALITQPQHKIITSAHPSPLSAFHGFFGSRPFSKINGFLTEHGRTPIDWHLEELCL